MMAELDAKMADPPLPRGSMAPYENGVSNIQPESNVMKVFAIAKANAPREQLMPHMASEVPATLKLYLDGKVEQFWFQEGNGPIFLMDVESVEAAEKTLGSLPLVASKLMSYEFKPVGPLKPLGLLMQGK
jgi:hypothetical protein